MHRHIEVNANQWLVGLRTWSIVFVFVVVIASAGLVGWATIKGLDVGNAAKVILTRVGIDLLSPEMVEVKAGVFTMGGPTGGRWVYDENIERDFKLGKYEVTFKEYELFVKLMGTGIVKDQGWGRGQRPAINVSWDDAKSYAQWLSEKTQKPFRLPTDSEWEYAARSRGKDEVWAGTSDENQLRTYAVYRTNRTAPVGSKKPNGLGLYDMSGNVWEWVEDCWPEDYEGMWRDRGGWLEAVGGVCPRRVIRGGSWDGPGSVRSTNRAMDAVASRNHFVGFRLAQDVP